MQMLKKSSSRITTRKCWTPMLQPKAYTPQPAQKRTMAQKARKFWRMLSRLIRKRASPVVAQSTAGTHSQAPSMTGSRKKTARK